MLSVGDKAPAISLPDQHGRTVKLSAHKGRRVLVYFYPKADTPGCTQQACALEAVRADIGDAVVIGISPDTPERQLRFAAKHSLGFTLLADTEHAVAEAYGVWKEKSLYGRKFMGVERSAFLVGPAGRIEAVRYRISPKDTPGFLLDALAAEGSTA